MKFGRRFIWGAVVVVTLVVALPRVFEYAARRGLKQLTSSGITVSTEGLDGSLRGVSAARAQTWLPISVGGDGRAFPLSLELSNLSIRFSGAAALDRIPTVLFSADAYGGSISGELFHLLGEPRITARFSEMDLSTHPQLSAAGFNKGTLSGHVESLSLNPQRPTKSSFKVQLSDASFSPPPMVSSLLALQEVTDANLSAEGSLDERGEFVISPLRVDSSIVNCKGEGRGALGVPSGSPRLSSNLRVELLGEAGASLAQWLPLISDNALDSSRRAFSISMTGRPCAQSRTPLTIGALCLTPTFAPLARSYKVSE